MRVRSLTTGIESDFPEHQARWLIKIGRCVEVKPEVAKAEDKEPKAKRATYQTKDMQADVAVQTKSTKKR